MQEQAQQQEPALEEQQVTFSADLLAACFERLPAGEQAWTVSCLSHAWKEWAVPRRSALREELADKDMYWRMGQGSEECAVPMWYVREAWPHLQQSQRRVHLATLSAARAGALEVLQWARPQELELLITFPGVCTMAGFGTQEAPSTGGFSSHGPAFTDDTALLKPDITAPGARAPEGLGLRGRRRRGARVGARRRRGRPGWKARRAPRLARPRARAQPSSAARRCGRVRVRGSQPTIPAERAAGGPRCQPTARAQPFPALSSP